MKKFLLILIAALFEYISVNAQPYTVNFQVSIPTDCNGGDDILLYSESGQEGLEFLIPELTLPPLLTPLQSFYDIFGGGSVGLEEGTLNENITLHVNLEPFKCSPDDSNLVELVRLSIQIIGEKTGPHPVFTYYQFNEGKRAYIKLHAQKLFEIFQLAGFTLDDIVAWFYAEGYTPDVTGITYEYNPDDPEWFYIYINHFSKIVLGTMPKPTDVESSLPLPEKYNLQQNYPNPFNPTTKISYSLPVESNVQLAIYNIQGELVKTLVNEKQNAGFFTVNFNADKFASGFYFYRLTANDFIQIRKMLLMK